MAAGGGITNINGGGSSGGNGSTSSGSSGGNFFDTKEGVITSGMDSGVMNKFSSLAKAYYEKTGKKLTMTEGMDSIGRTNDSEHKHGTGIDAAADEGAAKTEAAAHDVKEVSKEATADAAAAVEKGAADVKEKAQH